MRVAGSRNIDCLWFKTWNLTQTIHSFSQIPIFLLQVNTQLIKMSVYVCIILPHHDHAQFSHKLLADPVVEPRKDRGCIASELSEGEPHPRRYRRALHGRAAFGRECAAIKTKVLACTNGLIDQTRRTMVEFSTGSSGDAMNA